VVCLDSGCGNYEQLWLTTSLRGLCSGTLTVRVLEEGVHSGDASGVVPSCVRIMRQVLSRLEDETTGAIKPGELYVQIPPQRIEQGKEAARILGDTIYTKFPFVPGTRPVSQDPAELVINRTWSPQLAVIGISGLPEPEDAGNVMLPSTTAKLSLRLPPTLDAVKATQLVSDLLTSNPPYGAEVTFHGEKGATGWNAPALSSWLAKSVADASQAAFGRPPAYMGEGGTIPFMAMLGEKFPKTQFIVTGVLGPHSNAHGPNEFLHIPMGKGVTLAVAKVVADHRAKFS
jgi:acetylornithine deacetylase/succinyl-diaminopimelate desuccinylase-like protein